MPKYKFSAVNAAGKKIEGAIDAPNREAFKQKIRGMRLQLISAQVIDSPKAAQDRAPDDESPVLGVAMMKWIYKDANGDIQLSLGSDNPGIKDLIIFTKQFATMLQSGVTLSNALTMLARQQRSRTFRKCISSIRNSIESGSKLSDAMESYPKIFDVLFISMIRAGEASGGLDRILLQLTGYIERSAKIKAQIKKAMTYPTMVSVVAFGIVWGLLAFVVPAMAENFKGEGKPLPALTLWVMGASDIIVKSWQIVIMVVVAAIIAFIRWKDTKTGRYQFDKMAIKAPVVGSVLKKIAVSRFCNTMASMLSSGVNLLESLSICASSAGNRVLEDFILGIRAGIEKGSKLSEPMKAGGIFPDMVVSMIMVGEETGKIDEMLAKIAQFYDEEVEFAIAGMLSLIEPIMLVGIGGVVAVILLAMYLPMFEMAGNV